MDEAFPRLQEVETELARLREELAALRGASFPGHLLRALLEQTPDQVYFKDLQSRFILASRAVAQSFRIEDPNDLKGRTDFDFFSETHARQAYEDEQEILRTGLPKVAMEEVETWPDGRSAWVSTTKAPLKDPSGNVLGTFGISRNITNHKQAEFALKTSEERLRMLFDHAVDGILMGSPAGLILHANAVACDMAGRTQEELLGLPIARLFSPESLAATPLRFDLLQEGLRVVSERALLRQDGSSLPIEMHTKMMPDGTYQAIVRDISERKQAERALQASETHYRELLEGLQEGFAFTDTEERFVFVNPAASAIFGVPEGLQGHLLQEFLLPEVFQEVLERTEARKRGENGQYELPIRRPDGESRVIALSVSPWRNEAGDYLGTRGLFQDITERKRAEKALRESENNFRSLLERLGEGFAIVDPEERWTFANSATARTFGVEPGDLVGHRLREFVDEDTYQEILRQTERRRRGESSTYEIRIRRRDGAIRHVLLSASPYLGENGEYLGADGLFMDVTERRLAENALQESRERYLDLFNNTTDAIFWFRLASRWRAHDREHQPDPGGMARQDQRPGGRPAPAGHLPQGPGGQSGAAVPPVRGGRTPGPLRRMWWAKALGPGPSRPCWCPSGTISGRIGTHRGLRPGHHAAQAGRGGPPPGPEAGEPRRPGRRHRPRLQQPPHRHPGQPQPGPDEALAGIAGPALPGEHGADGAEGRRADQADAGLFRQGAIRREAPRPQPGGPGDDPSPEGLHLQEGRSSATIWPRTCPSSKRTPPRSSRWS